MAELFAERDRSSRYNENATTTMDKWVGVPAEKTAPWVSQGTRTTPALQSLTLAVFENEILSPSKVRSPLHSGSSRTANIPNVTFEPFTVKSSAERLMQDHTVDYLYAVSTVSPEIAEGCENHHSRAAKRRHEFKCRRFPPFSHMKLVQQRGRYHFLAPKSLVRGKTSSQRCCKETRETVNNREQPQTFQVSLHCASCKCRRTFGHGAWPFAELIRCKKR
ncbi:LANO_0D10044g1_1 [Lachancea nothofagi CBS 11611]|uniref:LANO_0D10044g1_1 n=1 Tax=Lachancea nothofagi CBS 11611 TaxID=1266666 RepID=A0A1G4JKL3_9SACH|nr:LANO_0D10044g1_1 [Lachancea nothofagi CBS 11611]